MVINVRKTEMEKKTLWIFAEVDDKALTVALTKDEFKRWIDEDRKYFRSIRAEAMRRYKESHEYLSVNVDFVKFITNAGDKISDMKTALDLMKEARAEWIRSEVILLSMD